jgi:uncharacterized membrane protein YsdA (DUF1294 family)
MHIPDGFIAPQMYVPAYAASAGLWALALRRLKTRLREEAIPRLAVLTALAFAGGWMLGYAAMRLFHHKTGANSQDFRNKLWGAVILELVIVAAVIVFL